MLKHVLLIIVALAAASLCAGCESTIVPMKPLQTIEVDVPAEQTATSPATTSAAPRVTLFQGQHGYPPVKSQQSFISNFAATTTATQPAATQPITLATTAPTTSPARHKIVKTIDPNQTTRFVYEATYDHIWQRGQALLTTMGFRIDRRDYRLGVMSTVPLINPEIAEPWRRDQTGFWHALENTVNNQRHTIRITISAVPDKPEFYEIAVQAMVERQSNPSEVLGGPIFAEGSGFGRNPVTLRSDYTGNDKTGDYWTIIGRDPAIEKKILEELFKKI